MAEDELNSLSFSSSGRSGSTELTASTGSTSSASLQVGRRQEAIRVSDLRLLRKIGSGDIGSVYRAEIGRPGGEKCVLAAKVMDKKELEIRSKQGRASVELRILEMLDHPFLPRLQGRAENDRWSCLLTEYCPGGDLHVLRQRQPSKRFAEPAVRFYAAEVVVALEYLHMLGIVYRDLKPENVLVRSDGHIMLTDFDLSLKCDSSSSTIPAIIPNSHNPTHPPSTYPSSTAATAAATSTHQPPPPPTSCILPSCIVPAVSCFQPKHQRRRKEKRSSSSRRRNRDQDLEFVAEPINARSMSFVGTHEYLAPEIVSGEGHGSPVDWWTLGVFVFELLFGFTPFRGPDNEATLANIVARALEFPKVPPVSQHVRDLVAGLLAKDPARRVGSATGAAAVKRHPFFRGVNWALLRCEPPPFVPPREISEVAGEPEAAEDEEGAATVELDDVDAPPADPVEFY